MHCPACSAPAAPSDRYCSYCGKRLKHDDGRVARRRCEGEIRFQSYVEHAPHGVFLLDEQGRYVEVNPAACRITGYDAAELPGMSFFDMLPAEHLDQGRAQLTQLKEQGRAEAELPFLGKGGRRGWWSVAAVKLSETRFLVFATDITRRDRMEQALRASEAQLKEAQRIACVGSWELEVSTGALSWSDQTLRIFEIEEASFGASYEVFLNAIHPEDRQQVNEAYTNSLQTRQPYNIVHRILMADGRVKFVRECCETFYDAAGRPLRSIGAVQDITELKRVEDALQESERRMRHAQRLGRLGFIDCDLNGQQVIVSEIAAEILGIGNVEMTIALEQLQELVHPADRDKVERSLHEAMHGAVKHDMEYRLVRPDGKEAHVRATAELRRDAGGAPIRLLGTILDVTERKQAEDELRAHSQVLLAMSEAVKFVDDQGVIRFTNRALDVMFGYEPGELIGLPVVVLNDVTQEENERLLREIMSSVEAKHYWVGDVRNRRKDGSVFWTAAHISPVVIDNAVHFVSVQRDITAQKEAEEQRVMLRTQLAHASRLGTLGEMAAGLAHELNQPLASLRLYAAAAQDLLAGADTQKLTDCLKRIDQQSLRAAEIVRRMRALASRRPLGREPANVNRLLQEVLLMLENELKHTGIATELNIERELPTVEVDKIQIQQVMLNLIRNAVEAMAQCEDGDRRLSLNTQSDHGGVRVVIADSGPGLDPAFVANLFEPFRTTKPTGLGLGLAICRNLIHAHRGEIGVEPRQERGAAFYFSLPDPQFQERGAS